jgi:SfnB family sulfur acquisition oxidoreductase
MSAACLSSPHTHLTANTLIAKAESLGASFAQGAAGRDRERRLPYDEIRELAASGVLAARVPQEYGGADVSFPELARIFMLLAKGDPNIAQAIQPHFAFIEQLRLAASEEQKRRYFGAVAKGALIANAFAERGGQFIGDISTTIQRDGEAWIARGSKFYCTGSLFADYILIIGLDGQGGRALAIIPRDREGLTLTDDWDGAGQRTTASGGARLDNVVLTDHEVIALPDWGNVRTHFGAAAQLLHASIEAGIALAALDAAVELGRSKARPLPESGVQRATDDPYVLHAVGEIAVAAHGATAIVERAAQAIDRALGAQASGRPAERKLAEASIAVAEAKAAAEAAALFASQALFRAGGASGTERSLNLDRHWRNARTHTTHDPVAYKYKTIGDFYLNGALPPITTKL